MEALKYVAQARKLVEDYIELQTEKDVTLLAIVDLLDNAIESLARN